MVRLSSTPAVGVVETAAKSRLAAVSGATKMLLETPVMDSSVSVTVTVWFPAVFSVTANVCSPLSYPTGRELVCGWKNGLVVGARERHSACVSRVGSLARVEGRDRDVDRAASRRTDIVRARPRSGQPEPGAAAEANDPTTSSPRPMRAAAAWAAAAEHVETNRFQKRTAAALPPSPLQPANGRTEASTP